MAKPSKREKRRKRAQRPSPVISALSNEPDVSPNATLDPEAALEGTIPAWMGPESTNAPSVGQEEEDKPYPADYPELLQRFLGGRIRFRPRSVFLLLTLGWFCFISWLFLQDNDAGRLSTRVEIEWFWTKAAIYSAFYVVVSVIVGFSSLLGNWEKGWSAEEGSNICL